MVDGKGAGPVSQIITRGSCAQGRGTTGNERRYRIPLHGASTSGLKACRSRQRSAAQFSWGLLVLAHEVETQGPDTSAAGSFCHGSGQRDGRSSASPRLLPADLCPHDAFLAVPTRPPSRASLPRCHCVGATLALFVSLVRRQCSLFGEGGLWIRAWTIPRLREPIFPHR